LYRERSFLKIRSFDLDLSQLADFLARLQPGTPEEPRNFRSQQPASPAFALRSIAQYFTHFFFHASPVPLRAPPQFILHLVLDLPNNKLRHIPHDIVISTPRQAYAFVSERSSLATIRYSLHSHSNDTQ
jgi:hypothetical protein